MSIKLSNAPLIEALLEIKWDLEKTGPDTFIDPGYSLASGRLYDRIKRKFPYIQQLPISNMPEELTAYSVRNQFRAGKNEWPLVQFGPGIASINYSQEYTWKNLKETISYFIPHLVDSYTGINPDSQTEAIKTSSVALRYINSCPIDWTLYDINEFSATNLNTKLTLPEKILSTEGINKFPKNYSFQVSYQISKPDGEGIIRMASGKVGMKPGLIWEIIITSNGDKAPQITNLEEFNKWLKEAHDVVEKWFYAFVDGELLKSYK